MSWSKMFTRLLIAGLKSSRTDIFTFFITLLSPFGRNTGKNHFSQLSISFPSLPLPSVSSRPLSTLVKKEVNEGTKIQLFLTV